MRPPAAAGAVEAAVRCGGLADVKVQRIRVGRRPAPMNCRTCSRMLHIRFAWLSPVPPVRPSVPHNLTCPHTTWSRRRMQHILTTLLEERGALSLEYVR